MASVVFEMVYNGEADGVHSFDEVVERDDNADESLHDETLGWYVRTGKAIKMELPDSGFDVDRIYRIEIR